KEHLTDFDRVVVVANLPYYITTPIIMKFLQETNISEFTLMVQKEVGQRLSGKPRTKEYNALSVLMNYMGEATIDYKVPKNSFLPEPKVESVVLRINKKKNDYALINESNFFSFIRHMFSQRRKTLLNNLLGKTPLNKDEIVDLLMALNFNPSVRAEELDLDSIIKLYKVIYEN
ncbi:MAG: rRNA adenine dimethyltransferase family protein, partial [Bacilli bacterium]